MQEIPEFETLDEEEGPSRTELKKAAEHMQDLGERLIKLTASELAKIPMPEILEDAVMLARRLTSNEGLRRQRQLIGKIMRKIEADPIIEALDKLDAGHSHNVREQHTIERWIHALTHNDKTIYDELKTEYPNIDLQNIRQLVRNIDKESKANKPPKSKRVLFKSLRDLLQATDIS